MQLISAYLVSMRQYYYILLKLAYIIVVLLAAKAVEFLKNSVILKKNINSQYR